MQKDMGSTPRASTASRQRHSSRQDWPISGAEIRASASVWKPATKVALIALPNSTGVLLAALRQSYVCWSAGFDRQRTIPVSQVRQPFDLKSVLDHLLRVWMAQLSCLHGASHGHRSMGR